MQLILYKNYQFGLKTDTRFFFHLSEPKGLCQRRETFSDSLIIVVCWDDKEIPNYCRILELDINTFEFILISYSCHLNHSLCFPGKLKKRNNKTKTNKNRTFTSIAYTVYYKLTHTKNDKSSNYYLIFTFHNLI